MSDGASTGLVSGLVDDMRPRVPAIAARLGAHALERTRRCGKTGWVSDADIPCTAIDSDWGDARPNILMHPPCACPRCAPDKRLEGAEVDAGHWLKVTGQQQRRRVEPAELGAAGRSALG